MSRDLEYDEVIAAAQKKLLRDVNDLQVILCDSSDILVNGDIVYIKTKDDESAKKLARLLAVLRFEE